MIIPAEREKMRQAYSVGDKMIDYLELIGIESLAQLRQQQAHRLQQQINLALGRPHINAAGLRALENLIMLARTQP